MALLLTCLFVFTFGLPSAGGNAVFVRDLSTLLGQLLTLMMFASPIFYTRRTAGALAGRLDYNPFTFYVEAFRSLLLGYGAFDGRALLIACAVAVLMLAFGYWMFRRLDPHFEDFL